MTILKRIPEGLLFDWMKNQLIDCPIYCAEQTGIEQLGYLYDLPKPTLDEVGELYFSKCLKKNGKSDNWLAKVRLFWREFQDAVEVKTLRELDQEKLIEYADWVSASMVDGERKPTYARQRIGAIKAIINFPKKRGKWAVDCQRALAFCAVLVPPPKSATDPHPISRANFHAMLNTADDQMKAMLLLALNCCMYASEVVALNWSDLTDETLTSERNKTGVVRIAVLWDETVAALDKLLRSGSDAIFITNGTKMQHNYQTFYKAFKALRKAAGCDHADNLDLRVHTSHLRDGAFTTAIQAGIDQTNCKLLAGQKTGVPDHYIKRNPAMAEKA